MPNIIRRLLSTLNGKIVRRFAPSRRAIKLPIKITVEPDRNTGKLSIKNENLSLKGETHDLSLTGLAFCVDSIRLREHYLVGEGRMLNAEIDLPAATLWRELSSSVTFDNLPVPAAPDRLRSGCCDVVLMVVLLVALVWLPCGAPF